MRKFLTIRVMLCVLVLAAIGPFLILAGIQSLRAERTARRDANVRAREQAEATSARIQQFFAEVDGVLNALSKAISVDTGARDANSALLSAIQGALPSYYGNLVLADRQGRFLGSARPLQGDPRTLNLAGRPGFQGALRDRHLSVAPLTTSMQTGNRLIPISRPIAGVDGEPVGVTIVLVDADQIQELLRAGDLPDGSVITLLDDRGMVLGYTLDPEWVGRDLSQVPLVQQTLSRREGSTTARGIDGVARLGGFTTVAGAPWLVYVGIPARVAFADARAEQRLVLLLGLPTLGAALLMAAYVAARIANPLRRVAATADALTARQDDTRVQPAGSVELRRVAWALNQLADTTIARLRELEAANRVKDEFLSVAAHELKTPVTSMRAYAQLLEQQLDRSEQIAPGRIRLALRSIDRQSQKLNRLVVQLLEVSRIDTGRLTLTPEQTDLVQLASGVVEAARLSATRHTITLAAPPSITAEVDPVRMEQVLTNLVDNGIKFSPNGGQVTVELAAAGPQTVRLSVTDQGAGIPPEHRAHVFERFHQAHPGSSAAGMGLGLYISRQIVELHAGGIVLEFPDGGGTRAVVTLPVCAPAPAHEQAAPKAAGI